MRIGDRGVEPKIEGGALTIDRWSQPVIDQDLHATLAALAEAHALDVRACGSCAEFRFSGTSFQTSSRSKTRAGRSDPSSSGGDIRLARTATTRR